MQILTIAAEAAEAPERRASRRQPRKSRSFAVAKLGHITADSLWDGGQAGTDIRPIWLTLAGTPSELWPFMANLRAGRSAAGPSDGLRLRHRRQPRYTLLKSAGYEVLTQRAGEEAIVTAFLPDLVRFNPGMIDPDGVRCVVITPDWWAAAQETVLRQDHAAAAAVLAYAERLGLRDNAGAGLLPRGIAFTASEILRLTPPAVRLAGYLDTRTASPIPNTLTFALQLAFALLRSGLAARALHALNRSSTRKKDRWAWARHTSFAGFTEVDMAAAGLRPTVAVRATHDALDAVLAAEVRRYLALTDGIAAPPCSRIAA